MAKSVVVGAILLLGIFNNYSLVLMHMVGGVEPNHKEIPAEVINKLNEHTDAMDALLGADPESKLTRMECTQQVVAGTKYECKFSLGDSDQAVCTVTVWYQAWMPNPFPTSAGRNPDGCSVKEIKANLQSNLESINALEELLKGNIENFGNRGVKLNMPRREAPAVPMPGGVMTLDTEDEGVKAAAAFSVESVNLNMASNSMFLYKMNRIVSASSQVVNGVKYVITLEMKETGCRNEQQSYGMLEDCAFRGDDAQVQLCKVQVLQSPGGAFSEAGRPECQFQDRPAKHANNDGHMTQV